MGKSFLSGVKLKGELKTLGIKMNNINAIFKKCMVNEKTCDKKIPKF